MEMDPELCGLIILHTKSRQNDLPALRFLLALVQLNFSDEEAIFD